MFTRYEPPEKSCPPPEQEPIGRFKQSQIENNQAVEEWLGGNGQLVFGVMAVIMVLGFLCFALRLIERPMTELITPSLPRPPGLLAIR